MSTFETKEPIQLNVAEPVAKLVPNGIYRLKNGCTFPAFRSVSCKSVPGLDQTKLGLPWYVFDEYKTFGPGEIMVFIDFEALEKAQLALRNYFSQKDARSDEIKYNVNLRMKDDFSIWFMDIDAQIWFATFSKWHLYFIDHLNP